MANGTSAGGLRGLTAVEGRPVQSGVEPPGGVLEGLGGRLLLDEKESPGSLMGEAAEGLVGHLCMFRGHVRPPRLQSAGA